MLQFGQDQGGAIISTVGAPKEVPLGYIHVVFRGLKICSDAEIGRKGAFRCRNYVCIIASTGVIRAAFASG